MERSTRAEVVRRLKSVEGHARGVAKMMDRRDVTYKEVVQQTNAIFSAVRSINMILLRDLVAEKAGLDETSEEALDDIMKAVERVTK